MSDLTFLKLDISNFKNFAGDHSFDLSRPPGLYYITGANKVYPELGANGVGKSTIWDALTWVLWGRTGRDNRPADAVKPWAGKGRTVVKLSFRRRGESYHLIRCRGPNSFRFFVGSDTIGKEVQQDEVPKLLGMSEEMFRRTLVLGQFGALFLDLKPEAQAQMFTEALGLDVWLKAVDAAGERAKASQHLADKRENQIAINTQSIATTSELIKEHQAKAAVFDQDRAQKRRKLEKGIGVLLSDLGDAQENFPERPTLPDNSEVTTTHGDLLAARQGESSIFADYNASVKNMNACQEELDLAEGKSSCSVCGNPLTAKQKKEAIGVLKKQTQDMTSLVANRHGDLEKAKRKTMAASSAYEKAKKAYDKDKDTYESRLDAYEKANNKLVSIRAELARWRKDLADLESETNDAAEQAQRFISRRRTMRVTQAQLEQERDQALVDANAARFWHDGFREIRLSIIDQTLVELEMATVRHAGMLGLTDWGVKFETERETKSGNVNYSFSVMLYPPGQDKPIKWESYSGGESQRLQLATAFALSEVLLSRAGLSPNIEVLDEPTRGLSAAGIADLVEHLRDRALELGRAVYLVDHHSLERGSFDGTLVVTKSRKGSSFKWQ